MFAADEGFAPDEIVGWAAEAGVSAFVGLAVGVIAFPVRWVVSALEQRRQEIVTACREAHRVLRTAQLDNRYLLLETSTGVERETVIADGRRAMDRAWDDAVECLRMSSAVDEYSLVNRLAELRHRAELVNVVENIPGEDGALERAMLDLALEVVRFRISHRFEPLFARGFTATVDGWERAIVASETELDRREAILREDYRLWKEQERLAAAEAAAPQRTEEDPQPTHPPDTPSVEESRP